jgi:hypothetical protein
MSLSTRMLVSLTLFCLNASRLMITFVPLPHRKRIEEAMKGVNMVIVEEKYFWKIYESAWNNAPAPTADQSAPPTPKATKNSSLMPSKSELGKEAMKNSLVSKSSNRESVLRSKVGEYIEIVLNSLGAASSRKFTFYRNVELVYNVETSELTLISEEDNKSAEHILPKSRWRRTAYCSWCARARTSPST